MYITDSSVRDALTANHTKIPYNQVIEDIKLYHGIEYRKLQQFTEQGNLTLLINTDGVSLFKSSSVSIMAHMGSYK